MTLVDRSDEIKRRLAYQGQLKANQEQARQVQDRTATIKEWRRAAALAHEQLFELTKAGRAGPVAGGTDAVLACRRFAEKLVAHTAGDGDWASFKVVVEKQVSAVERSALDAARAAQAQVRTLSLDNLEALARIQGKEAEFAALRVEKHNLEREAWTNRPADQLRNLLTRLASLDAGVQSLSDLKAPPDVQIFLDKARRSDAQVEDLTPAVRAWLDKNGLLGRLRITLGGR